MSRPAVGLWLPTLQPIVLSDWPDDARRPRRAPGPPSATGAATARLSIAACATDRRSHSFRRFMELPGRTRRAVSTGAVDSSGRSERSRRAARPRVGPRRSGGGRGHARSRIGNSSRARKASWASPRAATSSRDAAGSATEASAISRPAVRWSRRTRALADGCPPATACSLSARSRKRWTRSRPSSVDYDRHCRRAREIAEAYFRAELVLSTLLERIGAADATGGQRTSCAAGAAIGTPAPPRGPAG